MPSGEKHGSKLPLVLVPAIERESCQPGAVWIDHCDVGSAAELLDLEHDAPRVGEKPQALFAVNIDGTNERKIVPYEFEVGIKHDWAPDGKHIVITLWADFPDGHSPNVATVRPDGSHLRMLTSIHDADVGAFAGSYSPDGRWIAFRHQNERLGIFHLMKMHPDGSGRSLIAAMPFGERLSDWGAHR